MDPAVTATEASFVDSAVRNKFLQTAIDTIHRHGININGGGISIKCTI